MQGGLNIRRIDNDELSVLNDFASNINIVYNGEEKNQNQILNELYYKNFERYNNNGVPNTNVNSLQTRPKKVVEISDEPKLLEPGQVDPAAFFGSSLKGLF